MSGWTVQTWAAIVFGLFMIASGVSILMEGRSVPVVRDGDPRAGTMKLRYGDGGTDLALADDRPPRWYGYLSVAAGLFFMILDRRMDQPVLLIVLGGMLLVGSLAGLLFGRRTEARRLRRHEAELAALAARADSYSEQTYQQELRFLQATRPPVASPRRRLIGTGIFVLLGGAMLAVGVIEAKS